MTSPRDPVRVFFHPHKPILYIDYARDDGQSFRRVTKELWTSNEIASNPEEALNAAAKKLHMALRDLGSYGSDIIDAKVVETLYEINRAPQNKDKMAVARKTRLDVEAGLRHPTFNTSEIAYSRDSVTRSPASKPKKTTTPLKKEVGRSPSPLSKSNELLTSKNRNEESASSGETSSSSAGSMGAANRSSNSSIGKNSSKNSSAASLLESKSSRSHSPSNASSNGVKGGSASNLVSSAGPSDADYSFDFSTDHASPHMFSRTESIASNVNDYMKHSLSIDEL